MKILFDEIAPAQKDRRGGYTRIVRLNQRPGDAAQKAILEWVDYGMVPETPVGEKAGEQTKPVEAKSDKGESKAQAAK